jgi:hypothetical protein
MSEEVSEKESKVPSDKWFLTGLLIWFTVLFTGMTIHDLTENQCKVAAINKGMTASEVTTACK